MQNGIQLKKKNTYENKNMGHKLKATRSRFAHIAHTTLHTHTHTSENCFK